MKSLFLQKLYHLHRGYFYGMLAALVLFEAGMLALGQVNDAVQVDFWMTGGCLCVMMLSLTNGLDGWTRYRSIMPFTKRQAVGAEYLFLLGSAVLYTLIVSLFPLVQMLWQGAFDGKMLLFGCVSVFSVSLVLFLFSIPLRIRFGQKGVIGFTFFLIVPLAALGFLCSPDMEQTLLSLGEFIMAHDKVVLALCELAVIAVLTAVSWILSIVLYGHRDLPNDPQT